MQWERIRNIKQLELYTDAGEVQVMEGKHIQIYIHMYINNQHGGKTYQKI